MVNVKRLFIASALLVCIVSTTSAMQPTPWVERKTITTPFCDRNKITQDMATVSQDMAPSFLVSQMSIMAKAMSLVTQQKNIRKIRFFPRKISLLAQSCKENCRIYAQYVQALETRDGLDDFANVLALQAVISTGQDLAKRVINNVYMKDILEQAYRFSLISNRFLIMAKLDKCLEPAYVGRFEQHAQDFDKFASELLPNFKAFMKQAKKIEKDPSFEVFIQTALQELKCAQFCQKFIQLCESIDESAQEFDRYFDSDFMSGE